MHSILLKNSASEVGEKLSASQSNFNNVDTRGYQSQPTIRQEAPGAVRRKNCIGFSKHLVFSRKTAHEGFRVFQQNPPGSSHSPHSSRVGGYRPEAARRLGDRIRPFIMPILTGFRVLLLIDPQSQVTQACAVLQPRNRGP